MNAGHVEGGWELLQARGDEVEIHLQGGRVVQVRSELRLGAAARVVRAGRLGAATATGEVDRAELLERAGSAADLGLASGFAFPGPGTYGPIATYDPQVASLRAEELCELALDCDRAFQGLAGRSLPGALLRRTTAEVGIENSSGVSGSFSRTEMQVRLEGGSKTWVSRFSPHLTIDPGRLTEELARRVEAAQSRAGPPEGTMPVLFAPSATAYLLQPLVANLDGGAFASGASAFSGGVESPFKPEFWLWEDGTLDGFTGSAPFDGEGVPTRRSVLIGAGRQLGMLLDCATAARLGRAPTGTAVREEFPGLPVPGVNNLEMASGQDPSPRLIGDMELGLVVYDLMSEDALLSSGFAAQVHSGLLVRGGRVRGRVENAMVRLDLFAALRAVETLFSSDRENVGGTFLLPWVLIQGVAVGRG
jgi:PmbA protein